MTDVDEWNRRINRRIAAANFARWPTLSWGHKRERPGLLVAHLGQLGAFPIQRYENGINIVGYEWTADADDGEHAR